MSIQKEIAELAKHMKQGLKELKAKAEPKPLPVARDTAIHSAVDIMQEGKSWKEAQDRLANEENERKYSNTYYKSMSCNYFTSRY